MCNSVSVPTGFPNLPNYILQQSLKAIGTKHLLGWPGFGTGAVDFSVPPTYSTPSLGNPGHPNLEEETTTLSNSHPATRYNIPEDTRTQHLISL